MTPHRHRHDVVVVGARAAGAATALLLARLGHDVVLLDRAVFPADTLSIHQITFTAAGDSVTRAVKDRAGVDLLVAPRRYILDTIVAEAAAQAGVHMRLGVAVTGVRLDRTGAALELDARFVVGADGLGSRVARSVGAEVIENRGDHGAVQYAYFAGLRWHGIE